MTKQKNGDEIKKLCIKLTKNMREVKQKLLLIILKDRYWGSRYLLSYYEW
jgi:hypothetical protein